MKDDTFNCTGSSYVRDDRPAVSQGVRALWAVIVAAIVIPFVAVVLIAWDSRGTALDDAKAAAARTVSILAEQALKVFETNALALDLVDEGTRGISCAEMRASPKLAAMLARATQKNPQIETVWVLDADGFICTASNPAMIDANSRADRDYFAGARDLAGDGIFVGRGLIGRIKAIPFFSFARRRTSPDGAFTGIVLAAVDAKYFHDFWRSAAPPEIGSRMTLTRGDGAVLVRSERPIVAPLDAEGEHRVAALLAGAREHVDVSASLHDGVELVRAWKVLPGWGVGVFYAQPLSTVWRPWRRTVLIYAAFAAIAAAGMAGIGFVALQRQRREEAAARRAEAEMQRRLAAEDTLRQSQKMEAIGQLTGGIAHDFNNILMVVQGSLEHLAKYIAPATPKTTRLLGVALRGVERGTALTQRLLAFSRRQQLAPRAIDIQDLVEGMSDLLRRSLGPLVRLAPSFPDRLPSARADANQLELAILNLAVNARDAMPDGGVLTIAARQEAVVESADPGLAPGSYVCLSVTDTGMGMDEATLARAVEPFFTTKGVGKGTGLGLSMVHGFASQSGGRLVLRSQPGRGTEAELWLPAAEDDALRRPDACPAVPQVTKAAVARKVLFVDDDQLVLAAVSDMIEGIGHVVIAADSGERALKILRAGTKVDVVLTDHAMPGMTGIELADAIRTLAPGLPVIVMSGYPARDGDADAGLAWLFKPCSRETLAKAIMDARPVAAPRAAADAVS